MVCTTTRFTIYVALLLLVCFAGASFAFSSARRHTITDELIARSPQSSSSFQDTPAQWFNNLVDHFDPLNTETYPQRYWVNAQYYDASKPYTPIFITLCCEGECSPKWVNHGPMISDWAQQTGGLLVAIEHRYYGSSQPRPDWTIENLKYLTMEQALADAAKFIKQVIIPQYNIQQNHPVSVNGGSYGGLLAATMRTTYPNLVFHAVASSGVYDPKLDLSEFLDAVIESLIWYGGNTCVQNLSAATGWLTSALNSNTQTTLDYINQRLPLCTDVTLQDSKLDRQAFWALLTDSFIQIVQYNKENSSAYTVEKMCQDLAKPPTPQGKFDILADIHKNHIIPGTCYRWTFNQQVEDIGSTKIENPSQNLRQWYFQTVSAFGWYQPLKTSTQSVFGGEYDMEYFMRLLQASYGKQFTKEFILDRIESQRAKNNQYHIQASNIIFTSGGIDPWKTLAVQRNNKDLNLSSYHINSTAHCAPLYQPQPYDPQSLKAARAAMFEDFKRTLELFPFTLTNYR